eukprot:2206111-Amphidinium_carterae.1
MHAKEHNKTLACIASATQCCTRSWLRYDYASLAAEPIDLFESNPTGGDARKETARNPPLWLHSSSYEDHCIWILVSLFGSLEVPCLTHKGFHMDTVNQSRATLGEYNCSTMLAQPTPGLGMKYHVRNTYSSRFKITR